jgi:23S rRNA pseudouridine1911/1915/1917 synthase
MRGHVVFADDRLVAINKPSGVSLATRQREPHAAVERLLASLPAEAVAGHSLRADALWLVHRLDVGTSGLVLLARDQATHRQLVQAFSARQVRKTYVALCWGQPRPKEGQFEQPLGPDRDDRRKMRVDPDGRPARTRYRVLAAPAYVSLVELHPETGRTHQLRVHLAHAGHPIVGDDFYGGPRHHGVRDPALRAALAPEFTLLHAWQLVLPATVERPELVLFADPPPPFMGALAALGLALPEP